MDSTRSKPQGRWTWLAAAAVCCAVLGAAVTSCGYWYLETRSAPAATEQQAPDFTLPNQDGTPVSLGSLLEQGPAIVVFYRGHW